MYLNMKYFIIYLVVVTMVTSLLIAKQDSKKAITLDAMPKAVKGFPSVFKVTISGRQEVPLLSINNNDNPVIIHFKSESDANEYTIKSFRINYDESTTQLNRSPFIIPEGQKCTMIFDAWSLLLEDEKYDSLSDIPDGKYNVFLELETLAPTVQIWNRLSQEQKQEIEGSSWKEHIPVLEPILRSNTIVLELIAPSEQETQYIQKMRKISGEVYKDRVDWSAFTRRNINIDSNDMTVLTQVSREQMSLYKMISDVNIADAESRIKSIEDIKNASLPNFFESERQLLLLELKGNPVEERDNFLKQYPGLKWKVEELDSGKNLFGVKARTPVQNRTRTERTRRGPTLKEDNNDQNP